jgi:copper chaperone
MIAFEVNDMTCGHCVSTITKALPALDKNAKVEIDLARRLVQVQLGGADAQALIDAIQEAGYTPVAVQPPALAGASIKKSGCCCG